MSYLKNKIYELVKSDAGIFDFIQDSSLDGLWYWDIANPEKEWVNPGFWLTLGYSPDEATSKTWRDVIHPDDLQPALDYFKEYQLDIKHAHEQVLRFAHKSGSTMWMRCRGKAIRNSEGKPTHLLISHINITKEKQSEEDHKMLFNSIDEGFCIIEMIFDEKQKPVDYRFLQINAAFEKQTGLSDAVGKRMRQFAPNHEEHWFEIYGNIALTGESTRFENRAEQLHRWYDVYAFRFGDPKNMQVGILFNDITARKLAEEQMQALNKELEAFSYSVAHDLRAPLRSVNGYAQMLNEDYEKALDSEGRRILGNIRDSALKMGQLIDDLLTFSRLGRKEMQMGKINMEELTRAVLADISKSGVHNAEIRINEMGEVMGDSRLLYQVMLNLISNAIKYSSKKEKPFVEISSEVKGHEIIFSVKDNGAGFDMRYANKLFGVFQRLHLDNEFEGTGIGLAIVSRIISKHSGKVWAEGKVDEGANFHFALPV